MLNKTKNRVINYEFLRTTNKNFSSSVIWETSILIRAFSVNSESIHRDLSTVRMIIEEKYLPHLEIVFDNIDNTYHVLGKSIFNKKYILIILKILLENWVLNKSEKDSLLR